MATRNFAKYLWLILGAAIVLSYNACSTPTVPDGNQEAPDTAWWAYQDCVENLPPTASISLCDRVETGTSIPRINYTSTSGSSTTPSTGGRGPSGKVSTMSIEVSDHAFHEYVRQLDPATQAELAAKWTALANQAK